MFSWKYWEISKKPLLKNICVRLLLKRLQDVIDQDFLSGESLSKTSRLSNITKIPFAFKPEQSLNLTPTLYFELGFPIFIINGYDRKANACSPWTSCCYASFTIKKQKFHKNCPKPFLCKTTMQLIFVKNLLGGIQTFKCLNQEPVILHE